jgi:hypothetical protein
MTDTQYSLYRYIQWWSGSIPGQPYDICGGKSDTRAGFFEYFRFPCQFSFHQLFHIHLSSYHRRGIVSILQASLNNKLKRMEWWNLKNYKKMVNVLNTADKQKRRVSVYSEGSAVSNRPQFTTCLITIVRHSWLLCPGLSRLWLWLLHRTCWNRTVDRDELFSYRLHANHEDIWRAIAWPHDLRTSETAVSTEPLYPRGKRSLHSLDGRICGPQGRLSCGEQETILLPTEVEPRWSSRFSIHSTGKVR